MNLEKFRLNDTILCIDLKSFFASVECVSHGLNPMKTPLLVADKERGDGTIVLAVTPYLKKFGVPSRCRLHEVKPKPYTQYYIAKPRMQTYIDYSKKVINIYLRFVSIDDLFVYSIDEAFLDLTNYMSYYQKSAREVAKDILNAIHFELGLYATVGIGKNMVMSKFALDLESKHSKDFIAEWDYDNFKEKLWSISNLSEVWGIGSKTKKKLNMMGIHTVGQLANTDVELLQKMFGILGEELYLHAHCIDISKIQDKYKLSQRKGYSIGQTLFRDYFNDEILILIYEQCQEIARRLRNDNKAAGVVSLSISYSKDVQLKGIHKQMKLGRLSNDATVIYNVVKSIYITEYERDAPIRRISLYTTKLIEFRAEQPSMFDIMEEKYELNKVIDSIKQKFGSNSILYGSSYLKGATLKDRNNLIGGHRK